MAAERAPKRPSWRRQRFWVPLTAGAATVAVALAAAFFLGDPGGEDRSVLATEQSALDTEPDPDVADYLHQAADALEADNTGPITLPDQSQWLYTKQAEIPIDTTDMSSPVERWHPFTEDQPGGEYVTPFDSPMEVHRIYAELPEDTAAAMEQLYDLSRNTSVGGFLNGPQSEALLDKEPWIADVRTFEMITDLLHYGAAPPQVQGKLYRVTAEIPGISDDGLVSDGQGGQLRALRWDQDLAAASWPEGKKYGEDWFLGAHRQILLDPDTYHYRGVRFIDEAMSGDDKHVQTRLLLDAAIVDAEGQRP